MVDDDIEPILAAVQARQGLDLTQYRRSTLLRRVNRRLSARNCADLASYLSLLESDADEYDHLLSDLTVKYTEFFRDEPVFDVIREVLLPDILSRKRRDGEHISVWSAGCATGEEAYSLAVMLLQALAGSKVRASILATDIDPAVLKFAEAGAYNKGLIPKLPEGKASEYFEDDGKSIVASPEIKRLISFRVHDITSPSAAEELRESYADGFDLILCRNLLIYVLRPAQANIVRVCADMLKPDGFLVLGTGELIPNEMRTELIPVDQKSRIYRKGLGPT